MVAIDEVYLCLWRTVITFACLALVIWLFRIQHCTRRSFIETDTREGAEVRSVRIVGAEIIATCGQLPFTTYEIETKIGAKWKRCFRRYSDFYRLYSHLRTILPNHVAACGFPEKKIFTSLKASTIKERKRQLDKFLDYLAQDREGWTVLQKMIDVPYCALESESTVSTTASESDGPDALPADHLEVLENAETILTDLRKSWRLEQEEDGVCLLSQQTPNGTAYRTVTNIASSMDVVWSCAADCQQRMVWDKSIVSASMVDVFSDGQNDIVSYKTSPLGGGAVSSRHFVLHRKIERNTREIRMLSGADPSELTINTYPKTVRIHAMSACTELREANDGTTNYIETVVLNPRVPLVPRSVVDSITGREMLKCTQLLRDASVNNLRLLNNTILNSLSN